MVRFIHTSDLQIGMTRHFLAGEAQSRFTQDRIDVMRTLGRLAGEHGAGFILVAGDVFESNQLSTATVSRALEAMGEAQVPVLLLPGNHDPLDASSLFHSAAFHGAPDNIVLLDDMEPRTVAGVPGVQVAAAPWRSKRPVQDLVKELGDRLGPSCGNLRIAVAHGQIDSMTPEQRPDTISLASAESALSQGFWHYLALGDRHSVTEVGASGRIWFSGAPEATDFTEVRAGFALLVELEADCAPRVTELPVGKWRFLSEHRFINNSADVAATRDWLAALPDKARCVLKMHFEGSVNLATWSALQALLEERRGQFASLHQARRGSALMVLPDVLDEDAVALSGYAKSAWSELVAAAAHEEGGEAQDALALFYRLAQGGGGQ